MSDTNSAELIERFPTVRIVSEPTATEQPMVDLFSIDDVTYQIPAKPRVNIALKYLWHAKQHGEDAAAAELLEALLSPQGFEALMNYDELTPDDFTTIMKAAQKVTLGALEDTRGNSGRGRSR